MLIHCTILLHKITHFSFFCDDKSRTNTEFSSRSGTIFSKTDVFCIGLRIPTQVKENHPENVIITDQNEFEYQMIFVLILQSIIF